MRIALTLFGRLVPVCLHAPPHKSSRVCQGCVTLGKLRFDDSSHRHGSRHGPTAVAFVAVNNNARQFRHFPFPPCNHHDQRNWSARLGLDHFRPRHPPAYLIHLAVAVDPPPLPRPRPRRRLRRIILTPLDPENNAIVAAGVIRPTVSSPTGKAGAT
jgi:hypothetical protein